MSDAPPTITEISSHAAAARPELAELAREPEMPAVLVERSDVLRCAAVLDPRGPATEPEAPLVRLVHAVANADPADDVAPAITRLLAMAADRGATRVLIGWDPLDRPGLRMLEELGFAPTGTMPYFPLGPGQVEYVSGYRDPAGSTLDLVWRAGSR